MRLIHTHKTKKNWRIHLTNTDLKCDYCTKPNGPFNRKSIIFFANVHSSLNFLSSFSNLKTIHFHDCHTILAILEIFFRKLTSWCLLEFPYLQNVYEWHCKYIIQLWLDRPMPWGHANTGICWNLNCEAFPSRESFRAWFFIN